jgi:hypothetical protein
MHKFARVRKAGKALQQRGVALVVAVGSRAQSSGEHERQQASGPFCRGVCWGSSIAASSCFLQGPEKTLEKFRAVWWWL